MDYIDQALGDCGQSTSIESLFPHIEETDTFNILKECDIDVVSLSPPANGNNGIEAFDVSSLFEQFEASQVTDEDLFDLTSLGGTEQESDPVEISPILKNEPVAEECIVTTPPKKPNKDDTATQEIVEKIKSGNKPKTTVLLPLGVPLKQGKYSEIPQTNCTSKQVQRILKAHRHKSLINSKSSKKPDSNTVSVPKTSLSSHLVTDGQNKTASECAKYSPENDANNNLIHDHDYCSNLNRKPLSVSESENPNNLQSSFKDDESGDDSQKSVCFSEQSSSNSTDFGENCLSSNKENKEVKKISVSDYFQKFTKMKEKYKRNYRKSNKQDSDDEQYFDKIPTYYTALSIPGRTTKSKIDIRTCSADHIDRDPSPTRKTKDNLYNKIPDYHSCFTNSTKYDATALEKNGNSFPKYPWDEMRTSSLSNSASSSRSHSPVSYSRRYSRSPTRSSSRGRSYSRSRSRSRDKRRSWRPRSRSRSYSSYSRSSCSSHSRSRSRSRSRYRYSRSRSRYSRSCSRYRRSCSRYSRSRSRSPLYDRNRKYASRRSRSLSPASIRFREERKKAKEDRKQRQMDERRIVYVGRLPDNHTKRLLRQRFEKFGEIEEIGIHFREHGDNYGFVTFVYSCDAFAAVSKGNDIPGEPEFDLCFGGRRHFCESEYADLDGDMEIDEEYDPFPKKDTGLDFDALLKQAQKKIKKK